MNERTTATFTGLVDLAAKGLGAQVLGCSDDFFASKDNLILPDAAVFVPGKYTERGKWMDGWESRRKREAGHDWAIVKLGARGALRGVDIDTSHFLGNHPAYASLEAVAADDGATVQQLDALRWVEVLPQQPLSPGTQNMFSIAADPTWPEAVSHLRLRIFPDGGVARLRAYGVVAPDPAGASVDAEAAAHVRDGESDLAALLAGGVAIACSDSFFGPMNNLILPGRSENMGGGWETRRRRGPGHDWIVVRLGTAGHVTLAEVDTNYFKGNFPDRCSIDGVFAPDAKRTELAGLEESSPRWSPVLPETKLAAHTRLFVREGVHCPEPISHVRLNIFPDGGVSRLRLYGRPAR